MPISIPGEDFFSGLYVEQMVYPYLEENLHFNKIFNPVDLPFSKFTYHERDVTMSKQIEDGIQSRPLPFGEATNLSKMKITRSKPKSGRTYKIGYQIEITRDDVLEINQEIPEAINDYNWALNSMGFGIAYDVNYLIMNGLKAGAKAGTITLDAEHKLDQPEANPLKALKDMYYAQKDKTLLQKIDTYFMETTVVQAILDYCDNRDIGYSLNGNVVTIDKNQVRNFTLVDVDDMLEYGESLNMCNKPGVYPGADFYRVFDPKFSVEKANKEDAGDLTALQINIYDEDKAPHLRIVEAWLNCGLAVKMGSALQDQKDLLTAQG